MSGIPSNIEEVFIELFEAANSEINLEISARKRSTNAAHGDPGWRGADLLRTPGSSFIAEDVDAGSVVSLDNFSADLGWEDKLLDWPISRDSWAAVFTVSR